MALISLLPTLTEYEDVLPIPKGGTGLNVEPSLQINLASTSPVGIFSANPKPGVSGILPIGNGGTGKSSWTVGGVLYASATNALSQVTNAVGTLYKTTAAGAPVFGTLPIAQGGTGATTAEDAWIALGGGDIGKLNKGTSTTTYLRNDGTWGTPTNTDTKVTQTVTTDANSYPILMKNTTATATITDTSRFVAGITITPSTGTITATTFKGALDGNAASAGTLSTTLPVNKGGTGNTSFDVGTFLRGNGTGAITAVTPETARADLKTMGCIDISGTAYKGMATYDGDSTAYIRTTSNGLLPYSAGTSNLGTNDWPFKNVVGNIVYGKEGFTSGAVSTTGISFGYLHVLPAFSYSYLGTPSGDAEGFFKELIKWTCINFPDCTFKDIFLVPVSPGTRGFCMFSCYDTNVTNTERLPQYCFGFDIHYNGMFYSFGTTNYSYYYKSKSLFA